MNVKKNEICILEDAWTSSNCLEGKKINDTSPVWIMVNKKSLNNKNAKFIDEREIQVKEVETTDAMLNLANKSDLSTNKEIGILKSLEKAPIQINISNIRNLPNILKGPKTLSKSNTSSPTSFETEENSLNTNNVLTSNILQHGNNQNIKQNHHKRKQTHNPLLIQEELMNLVTNTTLSNNNESMKKNKFTSKKADKLTRRYGRKENCKRKQFSLKSISNKISFSSTPIIKDAQDLNNNAHLTTDTHEQMEEQTNDLNFLSELNLFYEDQFHEDYIDHIDILRDTLKEYEISNDNSKYECYDINSNNLFNLNNTESSVSQNEESQNGDCMGEKEYTWNDINFIRDLSDCEDSFLYNNDCPMPTEDLENINVSTSNCNLEKASICNLSNKNCLLSYFDNSSDEFCLKNFSYNCQQNSPNKDEVKNLDTLLLEEKKHKANLENPLNNLNSFKINVEDTNIIDNTIEISLSKGLGDSSNIRQNTSEQESDQFNVLLNTDLSTKISSDYPEHIEKYNESILEENHLLMKKSRKKKKGVRCNYIIKLNYKMHDKEHPLTKESKSRVVTNQKSYNLSKEKEVAERFQCLACQLTFTSRRALALHLAGAHGDTYVILCERCGRLFNRKCVFNRHFIHCGCVQLPYNCEECKRTYRHKSSLLYHLKMVHQVENKQGTTKVYKCDVCSKIYRKYRAFEKHLSIHILS